MSDDFQMHKISRALDLLSGVLVERQSEVAAELAELAIELQPTGSSDPDYVAAVAEVRAAVHRATPVGARLAVVSRGDDQLLRYAHRSAQHPSATSDGRYCGFHPQSGRVALAQLEAAHWRGAQYFVLPALSSWWLEHYPELASHLERRYTVVDDGGAAIVWSLEQPSPFRELEELFVDFRYGCGRDPAVLLWGAQEDVRTAFPELNVFSPISDETDLPYLDASIDIVVIPPDAAEMMSEARRVASFAVVECGAGTPSNVVWQSAVVGTDGPGVSVIVTDHGRPHADAHLRALFDSFPRGFQGEVLLLVEDADALRQRVDLNSLTEPVKIVEAPAGNFAGSVLTAVHAATEETVVVVDAATVLLPGWLPRLLSALRDVPGAGAVSGMVLEPDGRLVQSRRPVDRATSVYEVSDPAHVHVADCELGDLDLIATRRSLLLVTAALSGSDAPSVIRHYCAHLAASGHRVVYEPDVLAVRDRQEHCDV